MDRARFDVREIDHTADWAIRVRAPDLAGLFAGAATGMFGLLAPLADVARTVAWEFRHDAVDAETLLVDWLNELLFEAESRHVLFGEFEITALSTGPDATSIVGVARGGPVGTLSKTIKAVTFSGLQIVHDDTGYSAEVVFDV